MESKRQKLGIYPKCQVHQNGPRGSTSEGGYWTPIAQARVRIVVIVLLAAAALTLSILQSLLEPFTLLDLGGL